MCSEQFQKLDKYLLKEVKRLEVELENIHAPPFHRGIEKKIEFIKQIKNLINDNPNITIIELGKLVNDLIETEMKNLKNAKCFEDLKLGNIEVVNDLMHDFTRWTYPNKLFHSKITPIYFGKILVTILEHRELGKLDQSDVIFTKVLSSMIIFQIWLLFPRLESLRIFCKTHQT